MHQLQALMGQLRCVFDVVRLVDPEKMQVLDDGAGGSTRGCSYPQCRTTFLQYVNNYDQQFYQDVLTGADNQNSLPLQWTGSRYRKDTLS